MKFVGRLLLFCTVFWVLAGVALLEQHPERPTWLIAALAAGAWFAGLLMGGRVALWTLGGRAR